MAENFRRDASYNWIGIVETIERGGDRGCILMKSAERLLFTIKQLRPTCTQCFDQRVVITASCLINYIGTSCRGEETDEVKLLRCECLLPDNENTTRDECACLFGNSANERAYLIASFWRHNIEHGLPRWISDSRKQ